MKKTVLSTFLLIAYCAILIKVMVFKDIPPIRVGSLILNFAGTNAGHGPNFVPFKTILPYLLGFKGWIIAGINLVGNIALLVPIGFLVHQATLAVKEGLDRDVALRAITINPARVLGIDGRVGSLAVGKDADLVLWSGDPLDVMQRALRVFIAGREVYTYDANTRTGRVADR